MTLFSVGSNLIRKITFIHPKEFDKSICIIRLKCISFLFQCAASFLFAFLQSQSQFKLHLSDRTFYGQFPGSWRHFYHHYRYCWHLKGHPCSFCCLLCSCASGSKRPSSRTGTGRGSSAACLCARIAALSSPSGCLWKAATCTAFALRAVARSRSCSLLLSHPSEIRILSCSWLSPDGRPLESAAWSAATGTVIHSKDWLNSKSFKTVDLTEWKHSIELQFKTGSEHPQELIVNLVYENYFAAASLKGSWASWWRFAPQSRATILAIPLKSISQTNFLF